jgi:hypothetical protein
MGDVLEDWINPQHLTEPALAAAAAHYHRDPYESLWLDDFLRQPRLDALRGLFHRDGHFAPWFGLYRDASRNGLEFVDRITYEAAPPERRFEQETVLAGPKPGREMAPGFLTHVRLLHFLDQQPFLGFLARLTGIEIEGVVDSQIRISEPGHFVGRHRDNGFGRQLCLVFYPGESWQPSEGGHLVQYQPDGGSRQVEPRPNRLVLFGVSERSFHAVEPVRTVPRWGYTVWMGRRGGQS